MDKIDQRFVGIDQRFVGIDQEFKSIAQQFAEVHRKIDETAKELQRHMGVLFEEMINRLETSLEFAGILPPKIEDHEKRVTKVEEEIPVLRFALSGSTR